MEQLKTSMSLDQGIIGNPTYYRRKQFEPLLAALLDDPLLADVPKNPSVADIDVLIGVELGSAMKLSILKIDGTSFDVALLNTASVRDLKLAIKKKVNAMEAEELGHRHISWKHVWANFCLSYNNQKLLDDTSLLGEFGVKNGDELRFANHVASRAAGYHSHAKKRRFFHGLRNTISLDTSSIKTTL